MQRTTFLRVCYSSVLRVCTGLCCMVWIMLTSTYSVAQEQGQARSIFTNEFTQPFAYSCTFLKTQCDDSVVAVIQYRIRYDIINFFRVPVQVGEARREKMTAPMSITIETVNNNGITNQAVQLRDTLTIDNIEKARSKKLFYTGIQAITLPKTHTACVLDINKAHTRLKTPRIRFLLRKAIPDDSTMRILAFSDASSVSGVPHTMVQGTMLSDTVRFGAQQIRLLCILPSVYQAGEWSYTIMPDTVRDESAYLQSGGGIVGSMNVEEQSLRTPMTHPAGGNGSAHGSANEYVLQTEQAVSCGVLASMITPDMTRCAPGSYEIIAVSPFGDTVRGSLTMQWDSKPLSLRDLDYSMGLMRYLLNDATVRSMTDGGAVDMRRKFDDYWKQRDPTPDTEFNEDMTEFFARADYAYFAFAGVGIPDGARTDRGRVYMLNGKPTDIESRMQSNNVRREVWRYTDRVFKEFIFESGSNGGLVLKSVQDIVQ